MKSKIFISLCLLLATGCGKSDDQAVPTGGAIQSDPGVAANSYRSPGVEGYGEPIRGDVNYYFVNYRFKEGSCDTDRHSFSGPNQAYVLQQLCQGLQNQWMNHSCAVNARAQYFSQMCGGAGFSPR